MDSMTLYTLAKSLLSLSDHDPPDTFLYVTIGLIDPSAPLFVDSTDRLITNLKRSSLFLFGMVQERIVTGRRIVLVNLVKRRRKREGTVNAV